MKNTTLILAFTLSAFLSLTSAFPNGYLNFGLAYSGNRDYSQYDYITIWLNAINDDGTGTTWNPYWAGAMLNECKRLNKIPVLYGYVIAFEARHNWGLKDCDMGTPNLCQKGADYIRSHRQALIDKYAYQARNVAAIMGRSATVIFLMEPDFWQYYGDNKQENGPISGPDMRNLFDSFAQSIKNELPNAKISWDISAWLSQDAQRTWWGFFSSSPHINFIHTSGGQARADLPNLKPNELSWSFMSSLTGKKIIADCGYGIGGDFSNNCGPWDNDGHINNRMNDGVIAVSKANVNTPPKSPRPRLPGNGGNGDNNNNNNNNGNVNWGGNTWALGCDWRNNDMAQRQVPSSQCGQVCWDTPPCTHFTHNGFNGGTCWLKQGRVSPNDAFRVSDQNSVCGYINR